MDYIDQLKQFSTRAAQLSQVITTEEATKTALILPFFQMLGYDVFNPVEFVPEFTADVGIKKGEKVDYAIIIHDTPAILIEAKWCGETLESHDSQLFRYFGTTEAKIGILTNGILYRFYTDLDEPNKMDLMPFMEFNILDIKENLIPELKRFQRSTIDIDNISSAAAELRYMTAIKKLLAAQAADPDDAFVYYIMREVYAGRRTSQITEKFKIIVKQAFQQYMNDVMNDKFKSVLEPQKTPDPVPAEPTTNEDDAAKPTGIITTNEEIAAFVTIKALLHESVDASRISYKDTRSHFSVILDGKITRWICRLSLDGKRKSIIIVNDSGNEIRHPIDTTDDIFQYQAELTARLNALLQ